MKSQKCLSYVSDYIIAEGFTKKKTIFYKREKDITYCVVFYSPSGTVYCTYCVMPLYMPFPGITFTYGRRMKTRFYAKTETPSDEEFAIYRDKYIKEFAEDVIPYFSCISERFDNRFTSGCTLSSAYKNWGCTNVELLRLMSYTYVYYHNVRKAKKTLNMYLMHLTIPSEHIMPYTEECKQRFIDEANELLDLTDKPQDVITNFFYGIIRQNEIMLDI